MRWMAVDIGNSKLAAGVVEGATVVHEVDPVVLGADTGVEAQVTACFDAILAGIRTSPLRPEGPRVVYVRDTLELEDVLVSEGCRSLVEDRDDVEVVSGPEPLRFDDEGRLVSEFG